MPGSASKPIRVLKVVQSYFPFLDRGGPVVKVRALARGLARRGNEVTVLTADLGLTDPMTSSLNAGRCRWGWRAEENGVEVIYLPSLAHYRALTINPDAIRFCATQLGDYDIVHFYGLYDLLGPPAAYFCRRQGIPYVIEPMGMYRPIDRSFRLKRAWHLSVGRTFLRNSRRMIATSEMEQRELVGEGVPAEKLLIRYNGIDIGTGLSAARGTFRVKWGITTDEPLVLFISRLIPRKGADLLIEAFAQAFQKSGRLVIGGPEGERGYRTYLERRAQECGVAGRVLFTGPLYGEEKQAVLADADVFALPSRYENFANVAAEAIASDVPVIITESCGIGPLVNGRAGLVIAFGREALVGALQQLFSDPSLRAQLKQGCKQVAAELDWDRLTEQMEGCYATVISQRNGLH
jgi:glycosyltransferase involved in cell wall biosynthesis